MEWLGFIVKVHGDLDKIYLSSLEGTNEWNTKKMKIKLYCKVPNDILITILFRLLKKNSNNYFYDTVLPNQSLSLCFFFFWMDRKRLQKNIFCFSTAHVLPLDEMVSGDFSIWESGWF